MATAGGAGDATTFLRRHGGLVWRVGVDLALGPVTTATAALYFQRFYLVQQQGDFDAVRIAMACVWLASKVCEEKTRLRDIVNSFLALHGCEASPQVEKTTKANGSTDGEVMQMEAYWALRDDLILCEQAVLRAMAFDVEPTPAYSFLLEFVWMLNCDAREQGLITLAWTLLNDAFCSEICAVSPPARVAMACLLLAVEMGRRVSHLRAEAERVASNVDNICREPHLEDFLGLGSSSGGDELEELIRNLLAVYEAAHCVNVLE
mmetsp:Transcript_32881/g.54100  ORF Transcript_32881/g.54100 Transcript_32881/m.54100 type:complete len:263 (-) Transcript_32881:78-866(-)